MKIIFLDFDGVLYPRKAQWLPKVQGRDRMDPCAASMIKRLVEFDGGSVHLVISSDHRKSGEEHCKSWLGVNDIPWYVHKDWCTNWKMSTERSYEIAWWLNDHPDVTHYVAIDDIPLDKSLVPNATKCDEYEGFSYLNFLECRYYLDLLGKYETKESLAQQIRHHKRRHIWNTYRHGDPNTWQLDNVVDVVFPHEDDPTEEEQ